jgi:hypothetical protein
VKKRPIGSSVLSLDQSLAVCGKRFPVVCHRKQHAALVCGSCALGHLPAFIGVSAKVDHTIHFDLEF